MLLLTELGLILGLAAASCNAFSFIATPKTDLSLLGPAYLPVTNFSGSAFGDAKRTVKNAIDEAVATGNSTFSPFNNVSNAFAASVFSLSTGESLFDYYFVGPELNESLSTGALTEDAIFRTGSLGKLFTVYAWLVDVGDSVWFESISKYIVRISVNS
jgi:hypothetical protein